jgi:tRNA A37 methylthiotransferase MiaB
MKNIYFVQAAISRDNFTVYLPYASGCLITYALQDAEISSAYKFNDIFFMREEIDTALQDLNDPYLVAFSCVIGNIEYSKLFAKAIRKAYPECHIIFGGHGVSDNAEMLKENPFIDFSVCGEGEHAFAALLKGLLHNDRFDNIDNLAYRSGEEIINNTAANNFDIKDYPSPYLSGLFDSVFKKYPDIEFHAIIETNRGCPYSCAFCEWCFTKNIRYFPLERVKKEIEWMSSNCIEYSYCADANFGIARRDVEIAEFVVATRKKNGYPAIFRPTYAKTSNETVFEAGKILNLNGADKGVTIAYQSLNERTLELIGRKELSIDSYTELEERYSAQGIPTYTELILGLPGETYESFCSGLCRLIEAGQHNSIAVYQCQIYDHALMGNKEYQKKYGIQTARVPFHRVHHIADINGVQEYYDIVVGTADMDTDGWVKANLFSTVLQAFHHLGLLRCFAVYLHYEHDTGYYDFYNSLLSFIQHADGTFLQKLFLGFEERLRDTKTGDWTYVDKKFGKTGWYFEEAAFLEFVYAWDVFWIEILPFIQPFGMPEDLFKELLSYQKFIIRRPGIISATADFSFDFYAYFNRIYNGGYQTLAKRKSHINVDTRITVSSWDEYALKIILSGKRRGETIVTNEKSAVIISYS